MLQSMRSYLGCCGFHGFTNLPMKEEDFKAELIPCILRMYGYADNGNRNPYLFGILRSPLPGGAYYIVSVENNTVPEYLYKYGFKLKKKTHTHSILLASVVEFNSYWWDLIKKELGNATLFCDRL